MSSSSPRHIARFKRSPDSGFVLNDRDRRILRHLYATRLMSSEQLVALEGVPGADNQGMVRRLRRLYDAGYLDRPRNQTHHFMDAETGHYAGVRPLVYALGTRGAREIASDVQDVNVGRLRWEKKNREIGATQIEHALMTAQVYATLSLAVQRTSNVEVLFWDQGEHLKRVFYTDGEGKHVARPHSDLVLTRHIVYPDAFFAISVPGKSPGTRSALYFMLEADRGTMDGGRMLRKYSDYWRWNRCALHTSAFNIRYFVVLTLTTTYRRRDNLRAIAREADDHRKGSHLFRFGCLEHMPLQQPHRILGPVWLSPVDESPLDIFS